MTMELRFCTGQHAVKTYVYVSMCLECVNLTIDSKNDFGATPLDSAARCNSETCRPLLQFNADINSVTNAGSTPVQKAASSDNYNVCKILCENKMINVNWQNKIKEIALHQALFHRFPRYADAYSRYADPYS